MEETAITIDRSTLKLRTTFEPARPGLETQIVEVFARIMGVSPVGATDEFYDLGGDSLLGEQISMEILHVTGKVFPISGLFDSGTPRAVAAVLSGAVKEASTRAARETFFVVHGRDGYTVPRPGFMDGINSGARLVMFELPGIRGDAPFPRSIPEVAREYVNQIEREQPEGPVRLAAFCTGGLIAMEMAAILEQRGRALETMVLLDPGMPKTLIRRHRSMVLLKANPKNLLGRLLLFLGTGRLSESRPFLEPVWLRSLAFIKLTQTIKKRRSTSQDHQRYGNAGLKDWPRAWLVASYRYAWPQPSDIRCQIIASRSRAKRFLDQKGIWQHLLPNRSVHVLVDRHKQISGDSLHIAAAMETLLLGKELATTVTAEYLPAPGQFSKDPVMTVEMPLTAVP